ncbi:hypothetical protein C8Q75DRAFT_881515 [Abortiporus biennis]|nr:hypothetical protein C8Q75DRAFT_881515 [Abortiporus biennis]
MSKLTDLFEELTNSVVSHPYKAALTTLLLLLPLFPQIKKAIRRRKRQGLIPKEKERVLILGGTTGVGREIAIEYARRGARIYVVGRKADEIAAIKRLCKQQYLVLHGVPKLREEENFLRSVYGDFANPEDMVRVRAEIEEVWGGVDTIVVSAGVSALKPLLDVAEVPSLKDSTADEPTLENIKQVVGFADAAQRGNYVGPLVTALTFIPLLHRTSKSPSILLMSSLAALVPAPTRTLYGSTKAASLMLYQSLSIEHPSINFSFIVAATIKGHFRASAVDLPENQRLAANLKGLEKEYVAMKAIDAVDTSTQWTFLPQAYSRLGQMLYWIIPSFVTRQACKKYNFTPEY